MRRACTRSGTQGHDRHSMVCFVSVHASFVGKAMGGRELEKSNFKGIINCLLHCHAVRNTVKKVHYNVLAVGSTGHCE